MQVFLLSCGFGVHDLCSSGPSSNPVAIAQPGEATQPSLTCQGRRRGHDQISLMLSRSGLDHLPFTHHLCDSGTLGALPTAAFFSPCPKASPFWGCSLQPWTEAESFLPAPQRRAVIGAILQKEKGRKWGQSTFKTPPDLAFCSSLPLHHGLKTRFVWLQLHKRDRPCTMHSQGLAQTHAVGCQDRSGLRFLPQDSQALLTL